MEGGGSRDPPLFCCSYATQDHLRAAMGVHAVSLAFPPSNRKVEFSEPPTQAFPPKAKPRFINVHGEVSRPGEKSILGSRPVHALPNCRLAPRSLDLFI